MSDNRGLPSRQYGVSDDRLNGDTVHDRLDGRRATVSLNTCPEGMGARLSRLLHVSVPSASRGWRKAVCALAAALPLLLGAGGVAAQDAQDTLPTVSVSDVQAYEDDRWITFEVSLSQPSREEVTVEFSTSSGTATMGTDFRGGSQTLTFPPGRTDPRRVSVKLYDDLAREPDETFTVTLSNPTGATLGDATATGTIRNDDTAATLTASDIEEATATLTISGHTDGWWYKGNVHPCTAVAAGTTEVSIGGLTAARPYEYTAFSDSMCATRLARVRFWTLAPEGTPTVSISDAEASEDGTWMHFSVSLSQASREPVTVDVHTSSGTATSGTDFSAKSETLTFPANSRGRAFSVIVHDDQEPEPDETFTVTLTNPTNATLGDATATGTIKDDGDTAATLTPSDIEDTTATLTIGGHTDGWWYRGRSSGTSSQWGACTAVTAGTTAVSITGLKAMTTYKYWAYSDSGCSTKLANVKFGTLAPVGTPTVSISDAEASEDGTWIRFEVSLSQPSREEVWVRYETSSGTATSGTDFKGKSGLRAGSVLFDANRPQITRHARVKVYDDQDPEPDETFTVRLTSARGATLGDATATGTIRDDGDTSARLTASDIEDTTATLTISGHADGWWYRGRSTGTSSPWGGCTAVSAGTTAVSLSGLSALKTYEYEAFSDNACSTKLTRMKFRTIAPEGTPTVSISDAEVSEDGTWMVFKVSLSQPSRKPVTVRFETSGGTATSGVDFEDLSGLWAGHVLFDANSSTTTRSAGVIVYDDQNPEPDETFTVTLTSARNATLGDATATGTIRDDGDTAATLTPSDIEDTTATLTISGHADGWWYKGKAHSCTAVAAGTTAVSLSGLTTVTTYEYTAYSDSACSTKLANLEFRTLAPAGTPTVSVSDAEVSESGGYGGRINFEVSLSHPSREPVTVWYATSSGTATGGTDFKDWGAPVSISFDANSSNTTSYASVIVYDDQEPEPDETFTLTLTSARNATLGDATATGTIRDDGDTSARLTASDIEDTTATLTISGHADGWWYRGRSTGTSSPWGGCTAVSAGTTAVSLSGLSALKTYEYGAYSDSACSTKLTRMEFRTIAPAGTPTVSVSDAEVSEDNSWIRFNVSLSHPSREPVTVWFETSDGTATSGTDFSAKSGHDSFVSFSANSVETTRHGHVLVHDDEEIEPDESFTLTLTRASNAALGDATTATGTIRDNDTGATLAASDIEDTTATLTIAGHTDGWWYKGNAHACTAVAAGTTAVSIGGLTAVTDYDYTAYSDSTCGTRLASVAFRTLATEGVTPVVSVSEAEVSEDGGRMQFWVSLSQPSREEVTVDVQTSGGTATSGSDFEAVSQTLTFPANSRERQLLPVLVHDDRDPESDETFTVTLSNPTGATLGDATATGTIRDDDTGATLTASDIEDATATLAISGHTSGWWYKGNEHPCTAVAAGTTAVSIGGLTTVTDYDYTAYSDSRCQRKLARVKFRTLAPEGTPTVSVSDAQVSEDGIWMRFEVSLSQPNREQVTVEFETSGGTATSGTDFRAESWRLIFPANSRKTTGYANVLVHDDQEPEPNETFTVTLTSATGATLGDATTATGTIRDDDTGVTLAASNIGETTATLTVSGHTVGWWYKGKAHSCTAVAAGTTAVSLGGLVAVTTYEYTVYSDSACTTKLANVEFGTLAPEGTPTVSISDAQVSEDGTWMRFEVSLSQPSRGQVTVDFRTSGGTAASGTDFKEESRTLNFPANSSKTAKHASVIVYDDEETEPDETFTVTLTSATGATLGDTTTATGTIRDNDGDSAPTEGAPAQDTTSPGLVTVGASGDGWEGSRVVLTYSEALDRVSMPATGDFVVKVDGSPVTVSGVHIEPRFATVQLTMDSPLWSGQAVTVSYTAGADPIQDSAGNDAPNFAERAAIVGDVLPRPSAEPPPSGGRPVAVATVNRYVAPGALVTLDGSGSSDPDGDSLAFAWGQLPSYGEFRRQRDGEVIVIPWSEQVVLTGADRAQATFIAPTKPGILLFHLTVSDPGGLADGDEVIVQVRDLAPESGDATATGVALASDPGDDATYAAGDTVRVEVTFSEAVEVDTEDGTPRLKLDLGGDDGAGERWAAYEDGSGTDTLTFAWTAAAPDESAAGVAVLADTLELNGGTITSAASGADVALAHVGLDPDPAHMVDAAPPRLVRGEIDGGTMTLWFSEALDPGSTGGRFNMAVQTSETTSHGFRATGDVSVVGNVVTVGLGEGNPRAKAGLLERNRVSYYRRAAPGAGELRDFASNPVLAPHTPVGPGGGDWRYVRIDLVNVTGVATAVTNVAVVSDPGGDDTYGLEDTIRVRVTFGEPVDVTGTPRLKIRMDPSYGEKWAAYKSGTGTTMLEFTHTVKEPNLSTRGIKVVANSLELNGGTIGVAGGGGNAALGHDELPHDTDHKVDWRVASDTQGGSGGSGGTDAPTVSGVTIISDPGADDTYGLGDTIRVRVAFIEAVTVTGVPRIVIDMDPAPWGVKHVSYASGTGTAALVFTYTVVEPNYSPRGIAVMANSLSANGGTITSVSSATAANLAHGVRGHDPGHKVDWRPTISVADASAREGTDANAAFTVSLSRAFTSAEHSVTVDYATSDGTATAGADYTATSGTLTFAAGESTKTVNVPILDDAVDEGEETFTLRLSNATGGHIADGEATGTITNDDPLQKMWLSRFGRTVASHVTDAVSDRLARSSSRTRS